MEEKKYKQLLERKKKNRIRSYNRHLINRKEKITSYKQKDFLSEIRFSNRCGSHLNCFRYFKNNSKKHEITKFLVFLTLRDWNHDVFTEAIFLNGCRADIIDVSEGIIYEIINTEKEKSLKEKIKNYPNIFEVRRIDANKEFEEKMLL